MIQMLLFIVAAAHVFSIPLQAGQLRVPSRTETYPERELAHQPMATYQAEHVFAVTASHTGFWVEHVARGVAVDQALTIPDTYRIGIAEPGGVAVSFDGRIAVTATVTDREGRFSSVIAWLDMDGSLVRVVRTAPFAAKDIGFTADGSLWAIGMVKNHPREEKPVHDVMRQYDSEGRLVRTLLPRLSLSAGHRHPTEEALLLTSRQYAALVSKSSKTWTLVSSEGIIVGSGALDLPEGLDFIVLGAVTDSGRLFVEGQWSAADGRRRPLPLFEIDRNSGALQLTGTAAAFPGEAHKLLLGSEGENLVFRHVTPEGGRHRLVWSQPD